MLASWRADPSVWAGIIALGGLYAGYAGPFRRIASAPRLPAIGQVTSFGMGLLVLLLALESPLDTLGDRSYFFAHMIQHLLLVLVVPVLLLAGTPDWLLRPPLTHPVVAPVVRLLTRPLVAMLLFNAVFALAHVPSLFDAISANEAPHAIEHLVFLGAALLLWWPVLSPLPEFPRLSYPLQMGYLFLQTIPCSTVAAMVTLSGAPLYRQYATLTGGIVPPLQDQQIGGVIMWIGGTLYFFLAMAVVFFVWARQEERQANGPALGQAATQEV